MDSSNSIPVMSVYLSFMSEYGFITINKCFFQKPLFPRGKLYEAFSRCKYWNNRYWLSRREVNMFKNLVYKDWLLNMHSWLSINSLQSSILKITVEFPQGLLVIIVIFKFYVPFVWADLKSQPETLKEC